MRSSTYVTSRFLALTALMLQTAADGKTEEDGKHILGQTSAVHIRLYDESPLPSRLTSTVGDSGHWRHRRIQSVYEVSRTIWTNN